MRQPNTGFLTTCSMAAINPDTKRSQTDAIARLPAIRSLARLTAVDASAA
jgi:hypothetical protein